MNEVERFPLPEGVEDAVLNKKQLAEALGEVSVNTIDKWLVQGLPYEAKGTNGQAYEFKLSRCYAWKKGREAEQQEASEKAARAVHQMRMALLGGDTGSSEMALSPKQRKELYEAEHAYNKLAQSRGELIKREEVFSLLTSVFASVRATIDGMPDRLSRDAGLNGRQAEAAVSVADDLLAEMHRALSTFSEGLNEKKRAELEVQFTSFD